MLFLSTHVDSDNRLTSDYSSLEFKLWPRGGHSTFFFQVGVCCLDFWSVGLRTDSCLWKRGPVNWKFPNLGACVLIISKFGACELKMCKFRGLWAEIWATIKAVEAKISKFSQKRVLWTGSFAWKGTLANYRRGVKRGSSGPHIHIPISRLVSPWGYDYL